MASFDMFAVATLDAYARVVLPTRGAPVGRRGVFSLNEWADRTAAALWDDRAAIFNRWAADPREFVHDDEAAGFLLDVVASVVAARGLRWMPSFVEVSHHRDYLPVWRVFAGVMDAAGFTSRTAEEALDAQLAALESDDPGHDSALTRAAFDAWAECVSAREVEVDAEFSARVMVARGDAPDLESARVMVALSDGGVWAADEAVRLAGLIPA